MRCFFGLPIKGDIFNAAQTAVETHQNNPAMDAIRWTPSDNWHLTLRFLGNTSEEQREELIEHAKAIAKSHAGFEMTTNGLLLLPTRKPKVFCLSIRLSQELGSLVHKLENVSLECGFPAEKRPFLPHITLGRWKPSLHEPIALASQSEHSQSVDCFHLYQSESTDHGSVYTPLTSFFLWSCS